MSKDKATESKNHLKDEIIELATKLEKGIIVDPKTGVTLEKDDLYESNLPQGLTIDTIKQVSDYNTSFIAAGTYAFGKLAVEAMAGNKELSTITAELKMGIKDSLSLNIERKKEFVNRLGDGATVEKYGAITASYDVRSGKGSSGQLKAARNVIGELAEASLK